MSVFDLRLRILSRGDRFDLESRRPTSGTVRSDSESRQPGK
jgi:hypothetical protein